MDQMANSGTALHWLVGACTAGGVVLGIAQGGDAVIPPLVGALIWLIIFMVFINGLRLIKIDQVTPYGPAKRLSKWIVALIALTIVFALWHVTSPHAELRVFRRELSTEIRTDERENFLVGINVFFENSGKYDAAFFTTKVSAWESPTPTTDEAISRIEREISARLDRFSGATELQWRELPKGDHVYITLVHPFTPKEFDAFKQRNGLLFVAGRITFTDWWFWHQRTDFCFYTDGEPRFFRCAILQH